MIMLFSFFLKLSTQGHGTRHSPLATCATRCCSHGMCLCVGCICVCVCALSKLNSHPLNLFFFPPKRTILFKTQKKVDNWIGSSVIHLGDNNVPNALVFIGGRFIMHTNAHTQNMWSINVFFFFPFLSRFLDKYNQVPRILTPIVQAIKTVPEIAKVRNESLIGCENWLFLYIFFLILANFFLLCTTASRRLREGNVWQQRPVNQNYSARFLQVWLRWFWRRQLLWCWCVCVHVVFVCVWVIQHILI